MITTILRFLDPVWELDDDSWLNHLFDLIGGGHR